MGFVYINTTQPVPLPATGELGSVITTTVAPTLVEPNAVSQSSGKSPEPRAVRKIVPLPNQPAATKAAPRVKKKTAVPTTAPAKKVAAKKVTSAAKIADAPTATLRILANLRDHPKNRPATRTALQRHIATVLGNRVAQEVVRAHLVELERVGVITMNNGKIEYKLPAHKN